MAVLKGDTTIGGVNVLDKLAAFQTTLDGKASTSHNHSASQITSGTLPTTRGGTGATSAANALANLGAFPSSGGTVSGSMTITGDVRLKGAGNFGNKLNFGDGDYCFISEPSDDHLVISSTRNGIELIGSIQMPTAVVGSRPSSMTNGQVAFVYN